MKIGIITGASSGLGAEYALRAAAWPGGLDELWLIARREERLQALSEKITGCAVRCIPMDLADPDSFARLDELLTAEKPDVRLLVNCAGLGFLGDFEKIPRAGTAAMCDVNIRALTLVSAAVIPWMGRGSGMILVSSIASFVPTPHMSVYSASKSYVSALAKGLGEELRDRGITVTAVNPCPMETAFLEVGGIAGNSAAFDRLPRCRPDRVAEVSLRRCARGKGQYTPLALFKLYRVLAKLLPHNLMMKLTKL